MFGKLIFNPNQSWSLLAKRLFDIAVSACMLIPVAPFLLICYMIASADTGSNGLFFQRRIGRRARPFTICKLKTMHSRTRRISPVGRFFRHYKIDELPQLFNVLSGTMSLVGPRPDVEGYYDRLEGAARKILELRPGITSPAAMKYCDEATLLSRQQDALRYNDEVIFPDKIRMNLEYFNERRLKKDMAILLATVIKVVNRKGKVM